MPIYDYVCSNCHHRVEVIHGINDAGPRFCPSCGFEGTMTKAFTTPAVHFKGSGWAKKDRSSSSGTKASRSSSTTSDGGGSSGADAGSGAKTKESRESSTTTSGPDAGSESGSSKDSKPAASSED